MKQKITYWKESDGNYLGYLNDYPEYWTQGENLEDLKAHLWIYTKNSARLIFQVSRKWKKLKSDEKKGIDRYNREYGMCSNPPWRQT